MFRRLLAFSALALTATAALACSSRSTVEEPYVEPQGDRVAEQVNGACPGPSSVLRGALGAGEACEQGADCAPTCCKCNNGTNRSWLAVHCVSHICAGATEACADTDDDGGYCEAP